jgi:HEAT repeat protein
MIVANGRRMLWLLCGLLAATAPGCADLDFLPAWFPFQGPVSDTIPGVVTPAERIAELKRLSEASVSATAEEKARISQQLAESIRTEKDPLIRIEIIRALGRYPGPAADAILKAALSDADTHVRVGACEAWGRHVGDAQAIKLLSDAARGDVDADVRLTAVKALGESKNPQAMGALGEALNDPRDPAMQYCAMLSLKQVTGKNLGDNIGAWQQYVKSVQGPPTPSVAERNTQVK